MHATCFCHGVGFNPGTIPLLHVLYEMLSDTVDFEFFFGSENNLNWSYMINVFKYNTLYM